MTKYLWCAFLIVTAYGSVCAMAWAETQNPFAPCSEDAVAQGRCYIYVDPNLGPVIYEKADCLAKMEEAMKAMEPFTVKAGDVLAQWKTDFIHRKSFNFEQYGNESKRQEAIHAKAWALWESTKRACWRKTP